MGWLEGEFDRDSGIVRTLRFQDPDERALHAEERNGSGSLLNSLPETIRIPAPAQPFFQKVYEELWQVPAGETITYGELAARVGNPRAARAVGQAMARNPVCLLIPCHRVVPQDGGIGSYRWGEERKIALLEMERDGRDAWATLIASIPSTILSTKF